MIYLPGLSQCKDISKTDKNTNKNWPFYTSDKTDKKDSRQ